MADQWIMKPFFTLSSDSRTNAEALSRAVSKAGSFQLETPDDYVWVLHVDMKYNRMGVVFSDSSFDALLGWDLVGEDGQINYMEYEGMIAGLVPSIVQPLIDGEISQVTQLIQSTVSSAPVVSTLTEARVLEMFAGFGVSESRAIELIAEYAPQPDGAGISEERAIEIATELGVSVEQTTALIAQLAPQPDGTGFSQEDILGMISMNAPSPDGVGVLEDRAIELIEARVMTHEQVSQIVMAGTPDDVTMDDVIAAIAQYGEKADGVGISSQEAVDLIDTRAPSVEAFISMQAENQLLTDRLLDLEERIQFIEQPATVPVAETIGFEAYAEDVQAMIDMSNSGAGEGIATQEWVIDQLAMNSNEFEPAGLSDL